MAGASTGMGWHEISRPGWPRGATRAVWWTLDRADPGRVPRGMGGGRWEGCRGRCHDGPGPLRMVQPQIISLENKGAS